MTQRIARIQPAELLQSGSIPETELLNFVLKNGSVFLGSLWKQKDGQLVLRNTRNAPFHLKLSEIDEVWRATKTDKHD